MATQLQDFAVHRAAGRGADADRLRRRAGDAGRRRRWSPCASRTYCGRRSRLRAAGRGRDALAARGAADDRARPARGRSRPRTSSPTPTPTTPMATAFRASRTGCSTRRPGSVVLGRFGWKAGGADASGRSRPAPSPATSASRRRWSTSRMATAPRRRPTCLAMRRPASRSGWATPKRPIRCSTSSPSIRRTSPCRSGATSTIPQVLRGKAAFYGAGCIACHTPEIRHLAATRRTSAAPLPADLALYRPAAARHGRGARRPPAGGRGRRQRVAHAAALGHRPDRDGLRPHLLPPRRPGAQPDARPSSGTAARRRPRATPSRHAGGRAQGPHRLPGVAVMRLFSLALLMLFATPVLAQARIGWSEVLQQRGGPGASGPASPRSARRRPKLEGGLSRPLLGAFGTSPRRGSRAVRAGRHRLRTRRIPPVRSADGRQPGRAHAVLSRSQGHRAAPGAGRCSPKRTRRRPRRRRCGEQERRLQGLGALEFVLFGTGAEELLTDARRFPLPLRARPSPPPSRRSPETCRGLAGRRGALRPNSAVRQRRTATTARDARRWRRWPGRCCTASRRSATRSCCRSSAARARRPSPKSALFWRSGLTVPSIRANFEGIARLVREVRHRRRQRRRSNLWVDNSANFEFGQRAARRRRWSPLPVEQALADARQRKALDYLVIVTGSLQTLLGENLAAALGLSVGFSSLDGD